MENQYLIERIIDDANAEAKEILAAAKQNAKENVAYAKAAGDRVVEGAKLAAANRAKHLTEITASEKQIAKNIATLKQRTAIVNDVFKTAMDSIKFNWRVEKHTGFETRLTRPAIESELRENIEPDVVKILFGEV